MVSHMDEELSFEDEEQDPASNGAPAAGSVSVTTSKENQEAQQKNRESQSEMDKQLQSDSTGSQWGSYEQMSNEEKLLVELRSIYVSNVNYSATPDQLKEHFHEFGAIDRVTILTDEVSGRPKGNGYIQFADMEAVNKSISLNDSMFLGQQIKVVPRRTNMPGQSTNTNQQPKYIYPGPKMRSHGHHSRWRTWVFD